MTHEELEGRFTRLVEMLRTDMPALKNGLNTVNAEAAALRAEVVGLRAEVARLKGGPVPAATQTVDAVVARHPITGKGVTKAELDADPKLRLRIAFSEDDG